VATARARATRRRATAARKLTIHPLTPARWNDFVALFGPRGACAGCWCMWPRLTRAEWQQRGDSNRRAIKRIVDSGEPPGLVAYEGGTPVGWIALAPRPVYRRLERSRAMAPVDDQPVWSTPCFFVARGARGRGVTVALLRAACDYVASRGGRIVEGYPIDTRGKTYAPAFAWHGLVGAFDAAGFREVARRSPTRPIMRRAVRPRRAASRG
jgi:GNAT superfamily N-acetyltransferase